MTAQDPKILENLATAIGQAHGTAPATFIPEDAPFDEAQRHWLNGLLSGLHAIASAVAGGGPEAEVGTALAILYGSQSGNAEALSKDLRRFSKTRGFEATVAALDDLQISDLAAINHLLIVAATFGEGESTDNAVKFCAALLDDAAPDLPATLNYSVLGLGDSSYADFNKTARDIDRRLGELGATRAAEAVFCDVDFDDGYAAWREAALASDPFKSAAGAASAPEPVAAGPAFDKNHPFMATLTVSERLSGAGSAKCVNRIELSLAGAGADLDYAVGDALGVWTMNCPREVQEILTATGLSGKEVVELKTGPAPLRAALLTRLDVQTVTPKTLETWGVEPSAGDVHLIDLLKAGLALDAQGLVDGMRALQPRLYSISSSPKAHPGEVHLTVGVVRYPQADGTVRSGGASSYLADRLAEGAPVRVFVEHNDNFRLPEDGNTPVIMVGPGTGIAPFRAFIQQRDADGASGKNWLFFGNPHFTQDFLYQVEWQKYVKSGLLSKIDLAFSRDQAQKIYVQDRLREQGAEVEGVGMVPSHETLLAGVFKRVG